MRPITSLRPIPSLYGARGFSLAELMIASSIGLAILAALSTMFVKNTRAQQEIEQSHRQVENGRFAVDVLGVDLRNAGYYAEFDPTVLASPASLPAVCAGSLDELKSGLVLAVQGLDDGATLPTCLSDVRQGTDVLVVRRTATCVAGVGSCAPLSSGGPFFQASLCNNATELDSPNVSDFYALSLSTVNLNRHQRDCSPTAGSGTVAEVRRYLTHVYYVANNNRAGDGIPTLKRLELGSTGTAPTWSTVVPLAEGIENLQVEYGLDLAADGVTDVVAANPSMANGCTAAACAVANWRSAVAVRLHVLARNTKASPGYVDRKSYTLGTDADGEAHTIAAANDAYKRHVFQTQVALPNPAGRRLP